MTHLRKLVSPHSLNILLFLKANRKLWPTAPIIQKILNDRRKQGINDEEEGDKATRMMWLPMSDDGDDKI
jgi:hypothetical protein